VQALEKQIDNREVENHRQERHQSKPCGSLAIPAPGCHCVQVAGIKHPNNEGPDLFGVPAPVAVPRALGPDRTCNQSEAPEHETNNIEPIRDPLELKQLWKVAK